MQDPSSADNVKAPNPETYIEETPIWRDGTPVETTILTGMQWRIWWLACAGKFFEGMVVFMTGIALPLMAKEFQLGALGHGFIGSAILFGILIGATALGGLADRFGRRIMFIAEMALFILFLVVLAFAPGFGIVLLALFGIGLALGCDYPTAHMIISENIPAKARGRMVLGAFSFQAIGAMTGTGLAILTLTWFPELEAWRWMYLVAVVPAAFVLAGRFMVPESAAWLMVKGRVKEAEKALLHLLHRDPKYPSKVILELPSSMLQQPAAEINWRDIFLKKKVRRATIFASVPWFLQDLGTYGIGIFTPIILASALGESRQHAGSVSDLIYNDLLAAKGAALIDILLIVGILFAVLLTDRVGRIRLQVIGFIGCACGLALAAAGNHVGGGWDIVLIFAGFMLFNFMTNMGPNAQTYLIAGEVFPVAYRGTGAGFAASFAKIGAVMTAFLFPVLLKEIGTDALLLILVGTSVLGAVVTWSFQIETRDLPT
ncbi:MFS transporter [Roseibium denhamense]|uniref:Sugar transporter n=1 Tax=Roseibium denhamense TaxID=76305 RepID=A0ABY1NE36_9HYPH|nr:MFS transporter [Roseibium denhamense]MTI04300.1 MFS transporter [Roseibium denhamense]SMP07180.1 Sugar transporter [Roseibium denhamense]